MSILTSKESIVMKLFSKSLTLLLAGLLTASALLSLSACRTRDTAGDADPDSTTSGTTTTSGGGENAPTDERSLKEIYDGFIAKVDAEFPSLVETPVDKDNFQYYFGIKKTADIQSAFVSEPMMGAIPFGISMAKVKDGADAGLLSCTNQQLGSLLDPVPMAAQMKEKVDPRRWVCVTASFVDVAVKGDVILLVLDDDAARGEAIINAFKNA